MCRLLGVIANKVVDLEFSFLKADKPFKQLGSNNPDGWGIGWYMNGKPEIYKEGSSTLKSRQLASKTKNVRSHIILSHVRRGTGATPAKRNSHPFLFDNFIFAHNGAVDKDNLMGLLKNDLKLQLNSETDSEIFFYLVVQNIRDKRNIVEGIRSAVNKVREYDYTGLNFLMSDSNNLYAFRYSNSNRNYYSLYYLVRDPTDKGSFDLKSKETQMLFNTKSLNNEKAILVCSERLTEEKWVEIPFGNILIVDSKLSLRLEQICE